MVAPFRIRPMPSGMSSIIGCVFRTFDLAKPNPELAEVEVFNLLSEAASVVDLKPARILEIYEKYKLTDTDILGIQTKCLSMIVRHMMVDDSLSADERQDLKGFIKAIGIAGPQAKDICKTIGAQIYFERLRDAMADGEITVTERARLNNIKAIFAVKTEVPPAGVDKKSAIEGLYRTYADGLRTNIDNAQQALATLDALEAENPAVANLYDYITLRGELDQFESDMDAYLQDLQTCVDDVRDLNPSDDDDSVDIDDAYESAKNTERCIQESVATYRSRKLHEQMAKVRSWTGWSAARMEQENRGKYADRQTTNRRLTTGRGFDPKGSPKQKAWAYDIIAEQCLATPFWEFVEAKIKQAQTDDDLRYVRFANWLKLKPAGWWINTYQDTDLEALFTNFRQADAPS